MTADVLLEIASLQLAFGTTHVLQGVDLSISHGQLLGLVGPNGSGKTSLIRAIVGLLPTTSGRVRIDGVDISTDPLAARTRFGFAPDPARLPAALTGRQALAVTAAARGLAEPPASTWCCANASAPVAGWTSASKPARSAPGRSSQS
ncbi:MAG: ATP-binding cassette domain-containing protein [Rhodanobacteraceae bacterium]|nr:ATP-binding cassette domain-containing protein [Rhodanobacteraceae bacterium]